MTILPRLASVTVALAVACAGVLTSCRTPTVLATDALPLARASAAGDVDEMERLMQDGSPVNGASPGGYTALMAAARNGKTGAVRWLLGRGAEARAVNRGGASVYWHASSGKHRDIQLLLLGAGADSTGYGLVQPVVANPVSFLRQSAAGRRIAELLTLLSVLGVVGTGFLALVSVGRGGQLRARSAATVLVASGCLGVYYLTTTHWEVIRMDLILLGGLTLVIDGLGVVGLVSAGNVEPPQRE